MNDGGLSVYMLHMELGERGSASIMEEFLQILWVTVLEVYNSVKYP